MTEKNTPDAGLRDQVVQALITHSITESNGGRPPALRPSLLPPFVREKVESNAASRADAVMADAVAPALAAQDKRIAELEKQLADAQVEIDRADLRADRRAADLRARDAKIRELEERLRHWVAEFKDAHRIVTRRGELVKDLKAQLAAPVTPEARHAAIENVLALIIAKHQPDLNGHCGTGDGPAIRDDATDYTDAVLSTLNGGA